MDKAVIQSRDSYEVTPVEVVFTAVDMLRSKNDAECGPVVWPPRSPDLTTADFYLWGHLKSMVYAQRHNTRDEMFNVTDAAEMIIRYVHDVFSFSELGILGATWLNYTRMVMVAVPVYFVKR
jgi:hypothetical protein